MATNFPTSLDSYAAKASGDTIAESHVNDPQDAVEAVEAKVGIDSSAVNTSHDYFLKHASGAYRTHVHDGTSDDGAVITTIPKIKAGSFTRDLSTASGNQTISGVGFTPKAVIFTAMKDAGSGWTITGLDDGTTAGCTYQDLNTADNTMYSSTTYSIMLNYAGNNGYGKVGSFNSDGFVVAWTKVGSPTATATIIYMAIG